MSVLYKTVKNSVTEEEKVEKSRFIVNIKPVSTRGEAEEFFKEIRKQHKEATHNVPAFVLGEKQQEVWASDDGEPQGTAGAPIVRMLEEEGVTNLCLVVTRYFGGVKLGTGGLVRAYTNIAKAGLIKAEIVEVVEMIQLTVRVEYTYYAGFEQMAKEGRIDIVQDEFTDKVSIKFNLNPETAEEVKQEIMNMTKGTVHIIKEERVIGNRSK